MIIRYLVIMFNIVRLWINFHNLIFYKTNTILRLIYKGVYDMISIIPNTNGDTRTAPHDVTLEQFVEANTMHINDVRNVMNYLALKMVKQGMAHDYTKIDSSKLFYENFKATMEGNSDFVNDEWYQMHIQREKHHPLSNCHEDINLLDIIEMVVDCVCAGKARSGSVRPLEVDSEILLKALSNTEKLIDTITEIKDK